MQCLEVNISRTSLPIEASSRSLIKRDSSKNCTKSEGWQFLAARRQTVKNFIAGYSEGVAMLYRDEEGSKSATARFIRSDDPESIESSWQFGIDVVERIQSGPADV